ncbi:hypothetical protein K2173_002560 [Erythroxylum novogranatense]|uniref:UBA domain-containing protein n=1 Tax=Erythroxylum novogranatense TaxID=1862640 RepID=A0AAV8TQZ6_9ROSI|nr:hypothetical protein K2173_002560 [Erythroxylum novogranatense]
MTSLGFQNSDATYVSHVGNLSTRPKKLTKELGILKPSLKGSSIGYMSCLYMVQSYYRKIIHKYRLSMNNMSAASKATYKDKKILKEAPKAPSKPAGPASAASGTPANAYNPLSGTFLTLERIPTSSALPLPINGRFRTIDETDDHGGGLPGVECDSVSNNGSWSGESEDHKDKMSNPPARQDIIPGADNDKREKIRQKNERKHQRQKERRAQELHERCSGYLMSRKLETLAQQLVAMGFSQERATMALILNDGKVEESVTWLFDGNEDAEKYRDQNLGGGNLKIDISNEIARIADMETRFKCTKQEIERAVVSSEGDLDKAADMLRALKLEPPVPPKPEETGDPPTANNCKPSVIMSQNVVNPQPRSNPPLMINHRRDNKDFNYAKTTVPIGSLELGGKNLQHLKKVQQKLEWAKPQQSALPLEKRWASAGSNPSVSYSLTSSLKASHLPSKTETHYLAAGIEYKNLQPGAVREPVVMMQRPQSVNTKPIPATSISSSPVTSSWYPTDGVDITMSNGLMPNVPSATSLSLGNVNSNQMLHQLQYQQQLAPSNSSGVSPGSSKGNGLRSRMTSNTPAAAAASSLGLFSGLGSAGSSGASSPVDWSTAGSMAGLDYASIDWSMDRGLTSSRPGGLWVGPGSLKNDSQAYDSNPSSLGIKLALRSTPNGNGTSMIGLPDGGVTNAEASASGSHDWTSPFEGRDLLSLPRQFVSSPSL